MQGWQITLVLGALNFAATFGGVIAALKYFNARLDSLDKGLSRTNDNFAAHINAHAEGKFSP